MSALETAAAAVQAARAEKERVETAMAQLRAQLTSLEAAYSEICERAWKAERAVVDAATGTVTP